LIEAELFGIEDHVATGVRARKGIFEQAEDGTVLLDEIGDMPRDLQARLLRVLQEREFLRVGGRKPIPFRGRVIAATNADLQERVREGRFREDLFYRVRRLVIQIPPLHERRGDLPALARFFVERFCAVHEREIPTLSPALLDTLRRSNWPGNVRELENYLESLLVMSDDPVLEPLTLPSDLETSAEGSNPPGLASLSGSGASNLTEALAQYERGLIDQAIQRAGGNQSRAARLLGVPEPTLRYRLRRHSKRAG
jgi:DNA-binding NtrC family response regulator